MGEDVVAGLDCTFPQSAWRPILIHRRNWPGDKSHTFQFFLSKVEQMDSTGVLLLEVTSVSS